MVHIDAERFRGQYGRGFFSGLSTGLLLGVFAVTGGLHPLMLAAIPTTLLALWSGRETDEKKLS
jgi:hypothetical protein